MKEKLYGYQMMTLIILSCVGSIFLVSVQERAIGTAAWLALVYSFPVGLGINILFLLLFKRSKYATISEINKAAFGPAGNAVTVVYCLFFLLGASLLLNYYGIFTVSIILRQMELAFFVLPIVLLIGWAAQSGVTVIGRMGVVFSYVLLGTVAVTFLFELPYVKWENIFPLFYTDTNSFIKMAFLFAFIQFGDLMAVFCLLPYVHNREKLMKKCIISVSIGVGIVMLFCFLNALVLGDALSMQYSAFLRVMRLVDLGRIINRLEVLVFAGYFFATVFRLMVEYTVVVSNLRDALHLNKKTPRSLSGWGVLLGVGGTLSVTSILISGATEDTMRFITNSYPYIAVAVQVGLPAATHIALSVRSHKPKKQEKHASI
ncbi:MAG: GerAB/ArcD/ProY family transporter [Eubacteriales bacterium]